jgi:hypothetical protein
MRRILMAAAAVGATAVWAGTAQAVQPRPAWYSCIKAPKLEKVKTGGFSDSKCSTVAPTHEGKFERVEGLTEKRHFTAKIGNAHYGFAWGARDEGLGECHSTLEGDFAPPNRMTGVMIHMEHCSSEATGEGQPTGTALIGPLAGELGYLDEAHTQVGLDLTSESEPGGQILRFTTYHDRVYSLRGSMIATVTGDVNQVSKGFTITLEGGEYLDPGHEPRTNIPSFFEEPQDILMTEQVGGSEDFPPGEWPSDANMVAKAKGPAAEIKT